MKKFSATEIKKMSDDEMFFYFLKLELIEQYLVTEQEATKLIELGNFEQLLASPSTRSVVEHYDVEYWAEDTYNQYKKELHSDNYIITINHKIKRPRGKRLGKLNTKGMKGIKGAKKNIQIAAMASRRMTIC